MNDRNIVFETQDKGEATVVQSILESYDIEVFMYQESFSYMYGFYSPSIGTISLGVRADQTGKAQDIIACHSGKFVICRHIDKANG